jgi:hypothetical protein
MNNEELPSTIGSLTNLKQLFVNLNALQGNYYFELYLVDPAVDLPPH